MARRFKYGDIFIDDDSLVSKDGYSKRRRYVVSGTPGETNLNVRKIKKLKGNSKDVKSGNLIPIDKNTPSINSPSGISKYEYYYTYNNGHKERLEERHIRNDPLGRLRSKDIQKMRKIKKNKSTK